MLDLMELYIKLNLLTSYFISQITNVFIHILLSLQEEKNNYTHREEKHVGNDIYIYDD
jgi:hypothetical protein